MRETYKGLMSGIVYASKGDKVRLLESGEELSFVLYNGERFHVQNTKLSHTPVEADKEEAEVIEAFKPMQKFISKTKTVSKIKPQQSQLF